MRCEAQVAGLMLAAGFSRRFGSDKRLYPLSPKQTLLAASLATPLSVLPELWLVLRADDDLSALGVPPALHVVRNPAAQQGMGTSLACGMQTLAACSQADAVAILLGDMPWVRVETLQTLCAQAAPGSIVLPVYQGRRGHPVIFGRQFWPPLQALDGDAGARAVLLANAPYVVEIEVDDAGVLRDVDTEQALTR